MAIDLSKFAIGGAMRPDSFTGMNPDFLNALTTLIASAPPEIQQNIRINSGYRSPERQKQLWEQALQKYGSPEKARKWVAPPGRSFHNHGTAADLKFLNDAAKAWVHQNAGQFGLAFPLANEPWHIELQGNRGGGQGPAGGAAPAMVGGAAPAVTGGAARAMVGGGGPALGFMPTGAQDAPEAPASPTSPLAAAFMQVAPQMEQQVSGGVQEAPTPQRVGDPLQATALAMQTAQRDRQLPWALMPDLDALMGLGKRRG